ncbi:MAG TPA: TetR family transcriptional regulator [Pilimelia sp.]|nr:TetR family transcriptional regulator [Pilimelia sp.]
MSTARGDLTARALIRQESLRLFAAHGPDAVTVRQVAAAAGVSPALVVHHFASKEGLRRAVDAHVLELFDDLVTVLERTDWSGGGAGRSLAEAFLARLPPDSPVPAYLRRLLLSGDPAGTQLFRRWFALSRRLLEHPDTVAVLRPTADPAVRAAFLMVNDLALLLLREPLEAVLAVDPLSRDGLARWAEAAMDVYRHGLFREPAGADEQGGTA